MRTDLDHGLLTDCSTPLDKGAEERKTRLEWSGSGKIVADRSPESANRASRAILSGPGCSHRVPRDKDATDSCVWPKVLIARWDQPNGERAGRLTIGHVMPHRWLIGAVHARLGFESLTHKF